MDSTPTGLTDFFEEMDMKLLLACKPIENILPITGLTTGHNTRSSGYPVIQGKKEFIVCWYCEKTIYNLKSEQCVYCSAGFVCLKLLCKN